MLSLQTASFCSPYPFEVAALFLADEKHKSSQWRETWLWCSSASLSGGLSGTQVFRAGPCEAAFPVGLVEQAWCCCQGEWAALCMGTELGNRTRAPRDDRCLLRKREL